MPVKLVKKAYHSPWWIPALSVVAVLALAGTLTLFLMFAGEQRTERERSRQTDATFCARANDLRRSVVSIGDANEQMVRGIVDVVLPADATNGERAERIRAIRAELEPVFAKHRAAVNDVQFLDCRQLRADLPEENP